MLGQDDEATLDSIFNDDEETGEQVEETKTEEQPEGETKEEETTETKDKAETESEEESEDSEEVTPTSETSNHVPMDALISERRKRQDAEKRLSEYESKQKEEIPDPVADPEGFQVYNEQKIQEAGWQTRVTFSRELMLESKTDFEEKEKVFISLLGDVDENGKLNVTDQSLYNKFTQSTNPAKFAYEHATEHLDFKEKTSPDYEKNLREKIEAEIRAEYEKDTVDAGKVPNLTKHTAAQSNHVHKESDDSLEDVLEGAL